MFFSFIFITFVLFLAYLGVSITSGSCPSFPPDLITTCEVSCFTDFDCDFGKKCVIYILNYY
ncbi:hypothetical protein BpHYR1_019272 [Brachionus plicatilis]|uniref:WAP domain-containing protein n=1 Tax=Brachionus plicatilis TaxID=10195 RepID=A0A3M7PEJ7_BRAPC|nr:hypothetical protein BpHYR1_019272 [Brachionus plicatilis]